MYAREVLGSETTCSLKGPVGVVGVAAIEAGAGSAEGKGRTGVATGAAAGGAAVLLEPRPNIP